MYKLDDQGTELIPEDSTKPKWELWDDLPPEEEDALIEKIAQHIVKRRMGMIAQITLETLSPLTWLGAELGMTILGPYLEFFGVEKVTALFRRRENLGRLMDRIEELQEEQIKEKKAKK